MELAILLILISLMVIFMAFHLGGRKEDLVFLFFSASASIIAGADIITEGVKITYPLSTNTTAVLHYDTTTGALGLLFIFYAIIILVGLTWRIRDV